MFQQYLGLEPVGGALRLYAGLHPTGKMADPWIVRCNACPFTATARNHQAAVKLAHRHDQTHDANNERSLQYL